MNIAPARKLLTDLKSPVLSQGTLSITVRKLFTDVDGVIIAKGTLPANLQTPLPVYTLANFDRIGGNNIGQKVLPPPPGWLFLCNYVDGLNEPFLWNSGLNTINAFIGSGDLVSVYTDSYDAPTYFAFIIQSDSQCGLASVIGNTQTVSQDGQIGKMSVNSLSFQVDNVAQLSELMFLVSVNNLGLYTQNSENPVLYKPPIFFLSDFVDIPMRFLVTQYFGVFLRMSHVSDAMTLNFKINS